MRHTDKKWAWSPSPSTPARHHAQRAGGRVAFAAALAIAIFLAPSAASAQGQGPPPAVREAIDALLAMLQSDDEAGAVEFAEARLSESYRNELGDGVLEHLEQLREGTRDAFGDVGVEREDDGSMRLNLRGSREAVLRLELDESSGRFGRLELLEDDPAATGDGRESIADQRLRAIEMLRPTPEARATFRAEHLAPELRSPDAISDDTLDTIARAAAAAGSVGINVRGDEYVIELRGGSALDVFVRIGDTEPFLIESLRTSTHDENAARAAPEPLAWDDLEAEVAEAGAGWFSGTILAVRDGEVVLHESYGEADRASGRPNTNQTIYGIGSMPIDFTRAGIYLLKQRGALDLDDPISRFYPDAPEDKASITVAQLLSGRSGLPNFHHEATDADFDLTWIDRAEAERRILSQPLLFDPGTDRTNSHSAFVLLAAIIERVSGQSYEEFLRADFFEPIGMTRTGFYGDWGDHDVAEFAVGYGSDSVGEPNVPPNWGPTSWLIMGSGGMYSTPTDMHRWFTAMRGGEILTGDARDGYLDRSHASGASDRGFLFVHAWDGGESMIFLAQNSAVDAPEASDFRRRLMALVSGPGTRPGR